MVVDLVFVNENTPKGNVSVVNRIKTQKDAIAKFEELNKTTKIEYAYLRHFSGWHHHVIKWLKGCS